MACLQTDWRLLPGCEYNDPVKQCEPPLDGILRDFQAGRDREGCFRILFTRFYPQVHRFFVRKGMTPEDSTDLTQDVFFSVYKNLGTIQNESHFVGWLFRIAKNAFTNELEKRHAKKRFAIYDDPTKSSQDAGLDELASPAAHDVLQDMLDRERTNKLVEALETLPPQMRRCVQLRVAEDSTYEEIAVMLGISVNTVKAHLFKARRSLAEKLGSYFQSMDVLNPGDH
jgi:RNA polymerase sigma-70 factor (ECF subfamily)